MTAKSPQSIKAAQAKQSIMFPQGEDLPLFTGQAPTAVVRPFVPQESFTLPSLIDLRPKLKGAESKAGNKEQGPS